MVRGTSVQPWEGDVGCCRFSDRFFLLFRRAARALRLGVHPAFPGKQALADSPGHDRHRVFPE